MRGTLEERLKNRLIRGPRFSNKGFCLLWTGSVGSHGYGQIAVQPGRPDLVHRVAWRLHHGRNIPKGKEIDHLCNQRLCCNWRHLEAVSPTVNRQRQPRLFGKDHPQGRKTHCPKGHRYSEANTYVHKDERSCKRCARERAKERRKNNA